MAAIYKRHVGGTSRTISSAFPFKNESLPEDNTSASNTGCSKANATERMNVTHDEHNIFGRIANFAARINHDVNNSDITSPDIGTISDLSPVWNCDMFSSFESDLSSSPEHQDSTVAYTVEATVQNCIITNVNVVMKDLSDFPTDMPTHMQDSEVESLDDNHSTISNNPTSEDEFATASRDQPISHRLRLRRRHKTGGLFPRNADILYDWLDENGHSDQSETDEEDAKLPTTFCGQKQHASIENGHSTVVVEYDDRTTPSNDFFRLYKNQVDAQRRKTKDLKIVLCRSALAGKKDVGSVKQNAIHDSPNLERAKTASEAKLDTFAKKRLQADKRKWVGSTPGGSARRNERPFSERRIKQLQTERPSLKPPGATGPKDEALTDLRLAMEFPRHNWLVKHLRKEKMLKHDRENDDESPTNNRPSSTSPNQPPTSSPTKPNNSSKSPAPLKDTSSPGVFNPEDGVVSKTTCDVTDHVFVTSTSVTTPVTTTEGSHMIGIVKPFHYYNSQKSKSLSPIRREVLSDEPLQKRRKTEDIRSDVDIKKRLPANEGTDEQFTPPPMDCSINLLCDVKIEKYFSLADEDHVPLDLSNKEKATSDVCVLDLSSGNCQKGPRTGVNTKGELPVDTTGSGKSPSDSSGKVSVRKLDSTTPVASSASQSQDSNKSSNGDIELYELVRKRNMREELATKSKENGLPTRPAVSQDGAKPPSETVTTCLKKVNLPATGERRTPVTIIDVDALDDKLPTILPRQKPRIDALEIGKNVPASRPAHVRQSALPQGRHIAKMQQRNLSPGAANSLMELNQRIRAANYRTKSMDNLPVHSVSRFYEKKPQSAPPNIAEAPRVPSPALHRGMSAAVRHPNTSVELRRPNNNIVPITRNGQFCPTTVQPIKRRHGGLPSEQSLLSANTFMSTPPPYAPGMVKRQMENERFRVPVKPTPIHYHRLQQQQQQQQQQIPVRPASASRFSAGHHPVHQRHLLPRSNVVRAPPGGVSINSTPIRQPYSNLQMPGAPKTHNGVANQQALKMTPEAAQRFTAHLKVQQKQLEDKIHSLKELEKKIQPVPHYPHNHVNQQSDIGHMMGIAPNMFRNSALPPSNGYSPVSRPVADKLHTTNSGCRLPASPHLAAEEKCAVCMKRAYFVCSGCRSLWYCSKTCQFQDWTKHCNTCQ